MYTLISLLFFLPFITAEGVSSAQNATNFALLYGYPLLAFQNFADQFLEFNATNYLINTQELSSPSSKTVSDVQLTIPELPSWEFALFSFYDIYGDNYANIGTGNIDKPGRYLVQRRQDGTFDFGAQSQGGSQYVAKVTSPTSYGILLIRWGVNSSSINMVHRFQAETSLISVNSTGNGSVAPSLPSLGTSAIFASKSMTPVEKALQLLARYERWNQLETEAGAQKVSRLLLLAGISNGTYSRPSGVDLNVANNSVLQAATAAAAASANNEALNNGWVMTRAGGLAGNFNNGTAFAYRTAIASGGFLQLSNPNAVYPSWVNSSTGGNGLAGGGEVTLGPNDAILYTFSGKPALEPTGFWSLTAYMGNYLIPNSLERYAIGNRNAIAYPDGTPVYGSNATHADGEFQILVQPADVSPPTNWSSNWLPGPSGGGNISVTLRLYGAGPGLLSGQYQYPVVTKQAALTNGTAATSGGGNSTSTSPIYTGLASKENIASLSVIGQILVSLEK
ncbi:hypothetical protein PRZ48_011046 [Zasmidium cellare]|uniref:Uncharacterized protein n=1 Tax=Zasmidium cellare TaxID=395010 RepID=A0ABR0EB84_ZASCE|nr:hypothetical protein PRZ48_011046 [Zasmidium cellare]